MKRKLLDRLPFDLGRLRRMNFVYLACMAALMVIGAIFVYSANYSRDSHSLRLLYRAHAQMAAVGLCIVLVLAYIDYRRLVKWWWLLYLGGLALLVAVLLMGETRMGARRWVFGMQPSEIAKLATIVALASLLGRPGARRDVWEFLASVSLAAVPMLLIMKQPDFGTALVFVPITMLMLFAAGTAPRFWTTAAATGILAGGLVMGAVLLQENKEAPERLRRMSRQATFFLSDYQRDRLVDAVHPDRDPLNLGWNRRQSQIAVGSGGRWGKGFLKGDQNLLGYLPQQVSANDFIFSVLAEETGHAGALCVLLLYAGLICSALWVGMACGDGTGRILCVGVASLFFCHAFINIAMTIGLVPITGLPLPFISYGRTFMLTSVMASGLLQSVAVHACRRPERAETG